MKKQYLCSVKNGTGGSVEKLDYGVMVTQQILVLFFQVRILVAQLKNRALRSAVFCFFSPAEFGGAFVLSDRIHSDTRFDQSQSADSLDGDLFVGVVRVLAHKLDVALAI